MNAVMETLFTAMVASRSSEAEAQAVKAAEEAVRAAEQRLTCKEFEDLWNVIMDIGFAGHQDSFTLGFRLGVQLTLEGLRPIS